jgi:hypothetical protein
VDVVELDPVALNRAAKRWPVPIEIDAKGKFPLKLSSTQPETTPVQKVLSRTTCRALFSDTLTLNVLFKSTFCAMY